MLLESRNDLFKVEIPRAFFPTHILEKYKPYIHRLPTIIDDAANLVNHSIQSITIPNTTFEPVIQQRSSVDRNDNPKHGFERSFRPSINEKSLVNKEFSITFKMINGFFNYWILYDILLYYYDFNNRQTYTCDIPVRITDYEGHILFTSMYSGVIFKGLSEFSLSYADNIQQFDTFTADFSFNKFEPFISPE